MNVMGWIMTSDATRCAMCGGEFSATRTWIDGNQYHPTCALMSHGSHTSHDMARVSNKLWRLHEAATAFEAGLSEYCDGPERDILLATLRETYR